MLVTREKSRPSRRPQSRKARPAHGASRLQHPVVARSACRRLHPEADPRAWIGPARGGRARASRSRAAPCQCAAGAPIRRQRCNLLDSCRRSP